MTTLDCITALCYEVEEQRRTISKHPEAHLWPHEVSVIRWKKPALQHLCHQIGPLAFSSLSLPSPWGCRVHLPQYPVHKDQQDL